MESIENLLNICEKLYSCTDRDEVEELKRNLIESDPYWYKIGRREELEIRNVKKVDNMIKEVDDLIKEVNQLAEIGKFGDDLMVEGHEEMQVKFPTSNLVGDQFSSYIHEISHLLTKDKASTIGVWGMGGVGKTTLIKHLHNMMLDQREIYGSVYWITVSKDCSIQKLQTDLAETIGEAISYKHDELQRIGKLAEGLEMKKQFILILDDMWLDFDLNEVGLGIPKEIGYRLIVTSRSKDVCLRMYCDNIIKVDPLSPEDARTLFVKNIGREIPDDLIEISNDVLKECAGLPLGIITLAKSMIGCDDVCEWRNVLDELRNSSGNVDDMEEKVFKVLRLSYERLKDWEIKKCLLYCATYPEDCPIDMNELIWLFIDAGLLGKNVGLAKMFDKGLAILRKLERAALLSIECDRVRLHDLIRDMALQIAGSRFMIKAGTGLKHIPHEESWRDQLEVVSLMENQIRGNFDLSPECDGLSTLLLQRNRSLGVVPNGFFKHLNGLKLLELSETRIRTLPTSISSLQNLTALILRRCLFLEKVPSLAKITSLERLDLYQTSIRKLPEGIGSLIKLRYLNLLQTRIERIDEGVLNKLTALQYLAIGARIDVKELNSLNNLEHLSVLFEDFDSFCTFIDQMMIKESLTSYVLGFGNLALRPHVNMSNHLSEKRISLRKIPSLTPADNDLTSLRDFVFDKVCNPRESKVPDVHKYNHLLKILFSNDRKSSGCLPLKILDHLKRRSTIERRAKLFCENEVQKVLRDIHLLDIHHDGDLRSLGDFVFDTACSLQIQSGIERGPKPFSNLGSLKLFECSNLKKLFPFELLSNLQKIEEISVDFCEGLEELIEGAPDDSKKLSLLQLRLVHLHCLPNLKRLCRDDEVIRTPSLRWIRITNCPKLKRMAFDVDDQPRPLPQMLYLEKEKKWLESLEWDPPGSKSKMEFSVNVNP